MSPTISVIIPCYNGAAYLRRTIECVLGQTRPAFEIIVVDDGSTDDSAAIAESFGPPVRVVRQANRGEAGARNGGAAVANGSHFYFLDADDLIAPDTLNQLAAAAQRSPDAMILMRFVAFESDPARPTSEPSNPPAEFFPHLIKACPGVPHAWLTPASIFRRTAGFITTQKYFVDWEFWCQAALLNPPLVVVPYVGALYRRHPQSMSSTTPTVARLRGHVAVMETLAKGMLAQPALLAKHGDDLFWCCWLAIDRAREAGLSWGDLAKLVELAEEVARRGPASLGKSMFARSVRWLGFRSACWWQERLRGRRAVEPTRPAAPASERTMAELHA